MYFAQFLLAPLLVMLVAPIAPPSAVPDADSVNQVRIERGITIRISPRGQGGFNSLSELPQAAVAPKLIERKMGNCLPAASIAGVQPDNDNKLLLFLRDRRIVSASLERSCAARDFYSGFYLSQSNDGRICVDRDTLLSRSGANCKLSRLRELVQAGE